MLSTAIAERRTLLIGSAAVLGEAALKVVDFVRRSLEHLRRKFVDSPHSAVRWVGSRRLLRLARWHGEGCMGDGQSLSEMLGAQAAVPGFEVRY